VRAGRLVPGVEGQGLLAVRPRAQGAPAPAAREGKPGEEGGDLVAGSEPAGQRRHGERRVLGEHRDDRVDVVALPRLDVLVHEAAQLVVPSARSVACCVRSGRRASSDARGALERAVHRGDGRVERLGHLPGREPEHLAQDEDRALGGRKVLEGDDERQLDALPLLVARVRAGEPVLQPSSASG
jgi:hypothetical protein